MEWCLVFAFKYSSKIKQQTKKNVWWEADETKSAWWWRFLKLSGYMGIHSAIPLMLVYVWKLPYEIFLRVLKNVGCKNRNKHQNFSLVMEMSTRWPPKTVCSFIYSAHGYWVYRGLTVIQRWLGHCPCAQRSHNHVGEAKEKLVSSCLMCRYVQATVETQET